MREIIISENEAEQRLDRYIKKYLNKADNSFVYKMLRKKNIKLNNNKALPQQMLQIGDKVQLYLSENTINKFREIKKELKSKIVLDIVYEDKNIIVINKPAGISTQPDLTDKDSLLMGINTYLDRGIDISESTFRPAVCNRLDKNTSGLVIAAKNYEALKQVNRCIRERKIKKYYITLVHGKIDNSRVIKGYLTKDKTNNIVRLNDKKQPKSKEIITKIEPIKNNNDYTMLEIELLTGRTHQIRVHLFSIGHPIVGEKKYIDSTDKESFGLNRQFLHAYKIKFFGFNGKLNYLNNKVIESDLSNKYKKIINKIY